MTHSTALARRGKPWDPMLEFELYWFRLYLTRNASPRSEADGSWFIGDCDDAAELKITRWSPYSVCTKSKIETAKDRGFSLLEVLAVLAVLLTLGAIAAPTMLDCLRAVRDLMALVSQVVVH